MMKISDLKPGQKVTIGGIPAEYKGIEKVKISNFAIVEKGFLKVKESINTTASLMDQKRSKVKK